MHIQNIRETVHLYKYIDTFSKYSEKVIIISTSWKFRYKGTPVKVPFYNFAVKAYFYRHRFKILGERYGFIGTFKNIPRKITTRLEVHFKKFAIKVHLYMYLLRRLEEMHNLNFEGYFWKLSEKGTLL